MYLYINSEGGNIVPTMAIMDTMKYLNSEVGTVGFGSARAMGGLLLASGAKGKRAALPNTCIMLHHPSGVARGSASDIHNEGKELMRIRKQINEKVSAITGRSMEQVSEEIGRTSTSPRRRRWITASSIKSYTDLAPARDESSERHSDEHRASRTARSFAVRGSRFAPSPSFVSHTPSFIHLHQSNSHHTTGIDKTLGFCRDVARARDVIAAARALDVLHGRHGPRFASRSR